MSRRKTLSSIVALIAISAVISTLRLSLYSASLKIPELQARASTSLAPTVASDESKNATFVYLVTRHAYAQQLPESLHFLHENWLRRYPLPVTVFYTVEADVQLETLNNATRSLRKRVEVNLVAFNDSVPSFLSDISDTHCICCCNNLTAPSRTGIRGGHYSLSYCAMNRFRTLTMYRHSALASFKYFIQLDTDLYIRKPMPYDPLVNMTRFRGVFGFAEKSVLEDETQDCNAGLYEAIEGYIAHHQLHPKFKPARGTSYAGNFNIGDLDFLRSREYYAFALWINNDVRGIWTHRWGDQAFIPNVVGIYFDETRHLHFEDLYNEGIVVHKSESLGRKLYEP